MARRKKNDKRLDSIGALIGLMLLMALLGGLNIPALVAWLTTAIIVIVGIGIVVLIAKRLLQWPPKVESPRPIHARQRASARTNEARDVWPDAQAQSMSAPLNVPRDVESPNVAPPDTLPEPKPDRWSLDLLRSLDWLRFEQVVEAYWRARGYRAERTGRGPDGGIDIHLYRPSNPTELLGVIQCKSRTSSRVGVNVVRELFGVMTASKAMLGVVATTSEFTPDAESFAAGKNVVLLDGPKFLGNIEDLPAEQQRALLSLAVAGDYRTPSCPTCESKLIVCSSRRDQSKFWGCRNYPKCRTHITMSRQFNAPT